LAPYPREPAVVRAYFNGKTRSVAEKYSWRNSIGGLPLVAPPTRAAEASAENDRFLQDGKESWRFGPAARLFT
jgi:hypothetical protein